MLVIFTQTTGLLVIPALSLTALSSGEHQSDDTSPVSTWSELPLSVTDDVRLGPALRRRAKEMDLSTNGVSLDTASSAIVPDLTSKCAQSSLHLSTAFNPYCPDLACMTPDPNIEKLN